VDKQFDRFEIYVLRNILTVPEDLLNWLRLGHYEVSRGPVISGRSTMKRRRASHGDKCQLDNITSVTDEMESMWPLV
jgi:hypothetical protein